MLAALTQRIFGSANSRYLKGLDNIVVAVNAAEPALEALTDDELRAKTEEFRERIGERSGSLQERVGALREAEGAPQASGPLQVDPAGRGHLLGGEAQLVAEDRPGEVDGVAARGSVRHLGQCPSWARVSSPWKRFSSSLRRRWASSTWGMS